VDGHRHDLAQGDFGVVPPLALHTLEGVTNTVTPFAHLDTFYSPSRHETFVTRPGDTDLSEHRQLAQPRFREVLGVDLPVKLQPSQPTVLRDAMLKMIGIWQQRTFLGDLEAQHLATGIILSLLQELHGDDAPTGRHSHSLEWVTDSCPRTSPSRSPWSRWPRERGFLSSDSPASSANASECRRTDISFISASSTPRISSYARIWPSRRSRAAAASPTFTTFRRLFGDFAEFHPAPFGDELALNHPAAHAEQPEAHEAVEALL